MKVSARCFVEHRTARRRGVHALWWRGKGENPRDQRTFWTRTLALNYLITAAAAAIPMAVAPLLKPRAQHFAPTISIMRASGVPSRKRVSVLRKRRTTARHDAPVGSCLSASKIFLWLT